MCVCAMRKTLIDNAIKHPKNAAKRKEKDERCVYKSIMEKLHAEIRGPNQNDNSLASPLRCLLVVSVAAA